MQAERVAEIREQNRTLSPEPAAEPEARRISADEWAELKAAQTARVEAGKAERREAAARAMPVTDEEIARYSPAAENEAVLSPETQAELESIQASIDAAKAGADRQAEARTARDAELEEAGINEPVTRQARAEAEAGLEAAWEPGTGPADPAGAAGQADTEADAGLEI
jgi:hypothetical protein